MEKKKAIKGDPQDKQDIDRSQIYLAHYWFVFVFVYGQGCTMDPSICAQVTKTNKR